MDTFHIAYAIAVADPNWAYAFTTAYAILCRLSSAPVPAPAYTSKRKTPKNEKNQALWSAWGAKLREELKELGQTPTWLGEQVGYEVPSSINQVINGHQGCAREIYDRIVDLVPEMHKDKIAPPPFSREKQGAGSPGQHKTHNYPAGTKRKKA